MPHPSPNCEGARAPSICIEVALCLGPRQIVQWQMQLPAGATLAQAREAALQHYLRTALHTPAAHTDLNTQDPNAPASDTPALPAWQGWGIWGRKAAPETVLREGDRLEAYRPLLVDPKTARRQRFARQGARGAGLFAARRKGAKPGY